MRCIVVDDMGPMRRTVSLTLQDLGFMDIAEAKNGQEAYKAIVDDIGITKKPIELAIVDWNMEPVTGLDLLKMLRQDERTEDIIFIMITAEQLQDNVLAAVQSGVDDYIIKPFTPSVVKEKFIAVTKRKLAEIRKEVENSFSEEAPTIDIDKSQGWSGLQLSRWRDKILKLTAISHWTTLVPLELGRLFLRFEDFKESEKWLRQVIAQNFGTIEGHRLLSQALHKQGDMEGAIKELEIASATAPSSTDIKLKLGELFLAHGNYNRSIKLFIDSIKIFEDQASKRIQDNIENDRKNRGNLEPMLVSAHYNLIVAYKKLGKSKEAQNTLQRIQWMEPKDAEGWLSMGKAFVDKSEPSKVKFAFKKASELANGNFSVYKEISLSLYRLGLKDDVLHYLDQAKQASPSDVFPYNLTGIILRGRNKNLEAINEYNKAIELEPENAGLFYNLGVAYIKSGKVESAEKNFKKAIELKPDFNEAGSYLEKLKGN